MSAMVSFHSRPRLSWRGLSVVLALHAIAVWALAQMTRVSPPAPLAVLNVSLLSAPPAPEMPARSIEPPKPRPFERRPLAPPVREAAQIAVPAALPVVLPVAPVVETPLTAPAPPPPIVVPPALAAPSPPRFDANYLDNPKPVYPPLARRLGEEGRVVLRVQVAPSGLPLAVELHVDSGSVRLDQAALDTVRRWKFVPARLGGEPVAAAVLVPIVFSLKD